jgi:hypothetical protein
MRSVIDRPPPPVIERKGGGDGGWIPLFRASGDIEAHLLAGRLEQAGIDTRTIKDRSAGDAWMHNGSDPWTPVDIWVRARSLEDARIVLAEIAFAQPAKKAEGSVTRDWRIPIACWASDVALALALTGIALSRTADYLDRCDLSSECSTAGP